MLDRLRHLQRHHQLSSRALLLVAVSLVAAALASNACAAPKKGSYTGTTSERSPITFKVAGKKVTAITSSLGYDGKCGAGGGPGFTFVAPSTTIGAGGHFTVTVTAHAGTATGVIQISGLISGSSAHGTISEPKPYFTCHAPNQKVNPYSETFTANTK
jgi:uncharacterized membrane protein